MKKKSAAKGSTELSIRRKHGQYQLVRIKKNRSVWNEEDQKWYFPVADVVEALIDSVNVKDYIKKMRKRDAELNANWGTFCLPLELVAAYGKPRRTQCANVESLFRIIQSIPSPKAEPFKRWLARVGSERIDEIENPELSMERMKLLYEKKGYPKEWIDKRMLGIAVRQDLTDEWQNRGARTSLEYAILTNEIMQGAFDLKVDEYKQVKGLARENLRDHMTDIKLILTMLAETYDSKETCYILEGEVIVTPDGGRSVTIKAGDLVVFPAGMSCRWKVVKPIRKHYQFE